MCVSVVVQKARRWSDTRSFCHVQVVKAGHSTTFDVVCLARVIGAVQNTLYIHTSLGTFDYKVHTYIHTYIHCTCIHTYIHTYILVYIHTYMYICTLYMYIFMCTFVQDMK